MFYMALNSDFSTLSSAIVTSKNVLWSFNKNLQKKSLHVSFFLVILSITWACHYTILESQLINT